MSLASQLYDVLSSTFEVALSEINDKSTPASIGGWDSYSHLNMVLALEKEFRISIPMEEAIKMTSVQDIRLIIEKLVGN